MVFVLIMTFIITYFVHGSVLVFVDSAVDEMLGVKINYQINKQNKNTQKIKPLQGKFS